MVHLFSIPSPGSREPGQTGAPIPALKSILIHTYPVTSASWNPVRKGSLVVCCGKGSMYLWSDEWVGDSNEVEEIAECVGVPAREFFLTVV